MKIPSSIQSFIEKQADEPRPSTTTRAVIFNGT
jgi:hypothetical protein